MFKSIRQINSIDSGRFSVKIEIDDLSEESVLPLCRHTRLVFSRILYLLIHIYSRSSTSNRVYEFTSIYKYHHRYLRIPFRDKNLRKRKLKINEQVYIKIQKQIFKNINFRYTHFFFFFSLFPKFLIFPNNPFPLSFTYLIFQ